MSLYPPNGWRASRHRKAKPGKAVKMLRELRFRSQYLGGPYLWAYLTQKGVPTLLVQIGEVTYSITYFVKEHCFKVFYPFTPGEYGVKQEVRTFRKYHEVVEWLQTRRSS